MVELLTKRTNNRGERAETERMKVTQAQFSDDSRDVEVALVDAHTWLERANEVARTRDRRVNEETALLVHAYAIAADVHLREAELRAALAGKIVPAVETHQSRANSTHEVGLLGRGDV